jgi:Rod binding domain-containing protein
MRDAVQRLNLEYSLNLSDEEIEQIAKQVEAGEKLFQKLLKSMLKALSQRLRST